MRDILQLYIHEKEKSLTSPRGEFLSLHKSEAKVTKSITLVEKVLITRLKAGDYQAFSNIFTAYYKDLVIFSKRYTRDLAPAEEIVQDTYLKLWEIHETLTINTSLKALLLKIVHNKCLDWCRHRKVMQIHHESVMKNSSILNYDTENYLLCSEIQEQIDIALGRMPDELAEAFRMSRHKGLKFCEIADLLGVSVRTIEVRIGKALHLLRNSLRDYF
jgi:RNA polymerase sigma-70 factor (ECF subfamily)